MSRTIFLPSGKVETFSELLWIVAVNDFILKFVAVIFKILIVMLPGNLLAFRKRVSVRIQVDNYLCILIKKLMFE